jgi:NAD(P)-dependent dehydrogenase (short-subunit alcohol dehydrogenase family)
MRYAAEGGRIIEIRILPNPAWWQTIQCVFRLSILNNDNPADEVTPFNLATFTNCGNHMAQQANNSAALPEFANGTALVVGGSGGIGAAVCRALADAGSNVVLSYRSKGSFAETVAADIEARGRQGFAKQADLLNVESIKSLVGYAVERFESIHSVVYAAGPPLEFLYINEIEPTEWARVIAADVNGCFNLISCILPHFRERRAGSLVALVTAAVDRSPPRDILSAAPKAAIQMLVRGVAREEGRSGIRANCVGPGYIEAGLGLAAVHGHTQDYVNRMVRAIPLRRAGKAEDVADVVLFLLSDKARYVSGETICVAGGLQIV